MTNEKKYYLYAVSTMFAGLTACGGVLTAYYAELGFSNQQIASISTAASLVQVIVYIASIFAADRFKNTRKLTALMSLGSILPCLALLPFSITNRGETDTIFTIYFVASCAANLLLGLAGLLMYRLPYLIIDMRDYAKVSNISSIISNALSVGSKILLTIITAVVATRHIMTAGMIIGIVFTLVQMASVMSMKETQQYDKKPDNRNIFSLAKLRKKEISYFHIPNLLRGVSNGTMTMLMVICMNDITDDATVLSAIATIAALSAIVGSLLYQALRKKITTAKLFYYSSIEMFIFLPMILIGRNSTVFCIFCFLAYIGFNILSSAGAVYATEIVGYEDIGTYTAVRLIAIMLGSAVTCQVIAFAMEYIPSMVILFICGLCQLISGYMFYRFDSRYR